MENRTTKLANILTAFKETCTSIMDELKNEVAGQKRTLMEVYASIKKTSDELWEVNDAFEEIAETAENFAYDCDNLNEELVDILEQGANIAPRLYDPTYEDGLEVVEVDEDENADTTHIDELKAN